MRLQRARVLPPYDDVLAAVRRRKIKNINEYAAAYSQGKLPDCCPHDPREYDEWTSWAESTGSPDYHFPTELYDGLIALQLKSLGLLPLAERRALFAHRSIGTVSRKKLRR